MGQFLAGVFTLAFLYSLAGLISPKIFFWNKEPDKKSVVKQGGIVLGVTFLLMVIVSVIEGPSGNMEPTVVVTTDEFQADYDFGVSEDGKPNSAIAWFEVNGEKFYPVDKKSDGETILQGYTMANRPAISFMVNSYTIDGSERAFLEMTFRKDGFKAGKTFESIKSFDKYQNTVLNMSLNYKNKMYQHSLYDEFKDIYAKASITKIEKDIAYGNFEGKLYDTRADRNSVLIKGNFKLKLK